jgi:hypothetical protein
MPRFTIVVDRGICILLSFAQIYAISLLDWEFRRSRSSLRRQFAPGTVPAGRLWVGAGGRSDGRLFVNVGVAFGFSFLGVFASLRFKDLKLQ